MFRVIENFKYVNGCLFVSLIFEDKKFFVLNEVIIVIVVVDFVILYIICWRIIIEMRFFYEL